MIDISSETLLTSGGVAIFVALLIQVFKPALKNFEDARWYDLALNVFALVIGVAAAVLAQAAISTLEFAAALDAVLVGISGAALAVFSYEGVKNVISIVTPK